MYTKTSSILWWIDNQIIDSILDVHENIERILWWINN
jgi:hypothetical protein